MRQPRGTAAVVGVEPIKRYPLPTIDPGRVLLLASFTAANGTAVTTYTPEIGPAAAAGSYTIQSNQLAPNGVNESVAYWLTGKTSYIMRVTLSSPSGDAGPVVRVVNTTNYILCQLNFGGTSAIYKRVSGSYTALMTAVSIPWASGDIVHVEVTPTTVAVLRNGVVVMAVTDSTFGTADGVGFRHAPAGGTEKWDDLLVYTG